MLLDVNLIKFSCAREASINCYAVWYFSKCISTYIYC